MKQNTKTAHVQESAINELVLDQALREDLKTSILVVSIAANLLVVTAWLVLQTTTRYDLEIMSFLLTR